MYVLQYILRFTVKLLWRGITHDFSKFNRIEAELFTEYQPKLKKSTYGSVEYDKFLKELSPALDHHYKNRHHPEAHDNGIDGMDLLDLVEMFYDWKAATKKHNDGDILRSIEYNKDRFSMDENLVNIFKNSVTI